MVCPCGSETDSCHKSTSTQTCHCHLCSGLNEEICEICRLQIPSVCLANEELLVGEDVQPNTCECFFSACTPMDASEETDIYGNQTELTHKTDVPEEDSATPTLKQDVKNGAESTPEFSYSSDGYVLTPDEQSDGNLINDQDISTGSGEDSNTITEKKELPVQNLHEIERKDSRNERAVKITFKHSERSAHEFVNKQEITYPNNNPEAVNKMSSGNIKHSTIATETIPFYIGTETVRPSLPRPFPQHTRPLLPIPRIPIRIPGRFSNLPRFGVYTMPSVYQQQPTDRQQGQTEGSSTLSRVQLLRSEIITGSKLTPAKKSEIIENWLSEVQCSPPDEPSTTEGAPAEGHEQADFELSGISSDSKSSTELSEEENLRQRLSRRPPRTRRKSKK